MIVGGTLTTLGLAIGTPAYMAPEQAAGQTSLDARADVYAVGVLAYEMLSGQPPFTGPTPQAIFAAHITRTPAPLGAGPPDLAAPFAAADHALPGEGPGSALAIGGRAVGPARGVRYARERRHRREHCPGNCSRGGALVIMRCRAGCRHDRGRRGSGSAPGTGCE